MTTAVIGRYLVPRQFPVKPRSAIEGADLFFHELPLLKQAVVYHLSPGKDVVNNRGQEIFVNAFIKQNIDWLIRFSYLLPG